LLDKKSHLNVGTTFKFQSRSVIPEASLVRISSNTHTVNTDQRRVPLKVKLISRGWNRVYTYQTKLPDDSGILIPGQWMFFAMDKAGTPSIATILLIKNELSPFLNHGPYVQDDITEHGDNGKDKCQHEGLLYSFWYKLKTL
jgi:galactose oxidase